MRPTLDSKKLQPMLQLSNDFSEDSYANAKLCKIAPWWQYVRAKGKKCFMFSASS